MSDVTYYLIHNRKGIARDVDNELFYLDQETGEWVQSNTLFNVVHFEAATVEVTQKKAQEWQRNALPTIDAIWVDELDS